MKKALAFIAAALVVAAAQSATVTWTSGTMYAATGAAGAWSSSVKAASGSVVATYFIVSADTYNTYKNGGQDLYDAYKAGSIAYTTTGSVTSKSLATANYKDSTEYAAGATVYALAVYEYSDATYGDFFIANSGAAYISASGAVAAENSNGYQNLASSVGTWTAVSSSTPDPIPEPTTVALLALGLAAVGLKRKVA